MRTREERLDDPQAVRTHVNQVLCELEDLEPNHFPLSERTLERNGQACAAMFVLHGPRQLQVTAVWEWERGVIWFYNAVGERCAKTQLQGVVAQAAVPPTMPTTSAATAA